jgi:NitT/TauT family transport system substrate-binding protein
VIGRRHVTVSAWGSRRSSFLLALGSTLTLTLSAVSAEHAAREPERVRLQLLWLPQSQFAGPYVALEKGLYRERGVEVDLLRGGPGKDSLKILNDGDADFAILWLISALLAIDQGMPLAHVCQVFHVPHLEVLCWKERGIEGPADLDGRPVSLWADPFRPAFVAFFKEQGISPRIVPQYSTVNLFLLRGVDACSVMSYNEYHVVYQAGVDASELTRLALKDYGVDFPEDGLYCLRRTKEERPEVCRAVAEATLAGWRYAARRPEEALDIVMRHVDAAKLPTNRVHMRWMLQVVLSSVFPDGEDIRTPAALSRPAHERAAKQLEALGEIRNVPSYEELVR